MKKYQVLLFCALIILSSVFWCEVGYKRGFTAGEQKILILWNEDLDAQLFKLHTQRDANLFINHSEIK